MKKPFRILLGGSPCTFWSIAQNNSKREKVPHSGLGWDLFENFLIAKQKFKPDVVLYENNASISQALKDEIVFLLGDLNFYEINSALFSAQQRKRFYVTNLPLHPIDRECTLTVKDILETPGRSLTGNEKSYCLTATYGKASPRDTLKKSSREMIAAPIRVGDLPNGKGEISGSQCTRIYSIEGKSVNLVANGGGQGAKTGLYAIKSGVDECWKRSYLVLDGKLRVGDREYPCKLEDGWWNIRKLTPVECERLQTLPDDYTKYRYVFGKEDYVRYYVSDTQRYKCLGNGWTAEVVMHLLAGLYELVGMDDEIEVLSMYDGIATARYVLDKLGYKKVKYVCYETDQYASGIAKYNWPKIINLGDAFGIRDRYEEVEIAFEYNDFY